MNCVKLNHVIAFLILIGVGTTTAPSRADEATLRAYANGAGPTAIFRYGRDAEDRRDVFGVVDPVLWRIQFYTIEDRRPGGPDLEARRKEVGACRLSPTFRVWRVHSFSDRIVLQSQPQVTEDKLFKSKQFSHTKIELPITRAAIDDIVSRPKTAFNDAPAIDCAAGAQGSKSLSDFVPDKDSAVSVTGGGDKESFKISRRLLPKDAPGFLRTQIEVRPAGRFLVSAQELEASADPQAGLVRHFITTARASGDGDSQPGFVTSVVTIERRTQKSSAKQSMRLNLGLSRVKAGQKFVAISSVGEVLLIGAADHNDFKFYSCNFDALPATAKSRCSVESTPQDSTTALTSDEGKKGPLELGDPSGRWQQALWFASQSYNVDADKAPCRQVKPCKFPVTSERWAPLSELRLATGRYTRVGVPYAQSTRDDGRPPGQGNTLAFPSAEETKATPVALRRSEGSRTYVFGDIENSDIVTSDSVSVFGIDCSALVTSLWRLKARLDTKGFIAQADAGSIERIAEIGRVKMDDAFVINLADTLNHITMFREMRKVGPMDSSLAVLVMESSSSCGGACWTYYDESFFHGWAIIRKGSAKNGDYEKIPLDFPSWSKLFIK